MVGDDPTFFNVRNQGVTNRVLKRYETKGTEEMIINGIKENLLREATIVILQGTDGTYYAQSASLCKGKTMEEAARRCARCLTDYEFAKKYDMYQNGDIKQD